MTEKPTIKTILPVDPSATKHSWPEGKRHEPIDSPLIQKEHSEAFVDWLALRQDHELPVDLARSEGNKINLATSSMTTASDFNSGHYRERAASVDADGNLRGIHVLSHDDESRHKQRSAVLAAAPTLKYDPSRIEKKF